MKITDFTTPDHVILGLQARDKAHLLDELARRASKFTGLAAGFILKALDSREQLGSTGLGRGIGLPHARIEGLQRLFGMFVRLSRPLEFEAIDEQPVDLVFLLLIPDRAGNEHVAALAAISRKLRDPSTAERLRAASDAEAAYELLAAS